MNHFERIAAGSTKWILPAGKHIAFPAIAALFVLVRLWNVYPVVFEEPGETRLSGVDSYFHLRHAQYSADNFPRLLRYDPGSHYPTHGRQSFTGLFNLAISAGAILGTGFHPSEKAVARVAAWMPVVLGVATLIGLFLLAKFFGGLEIGLFAAFVFTIYPGSSLPRSMLGFADQHVAEFLLVFLSMAGLVYCLNRTAENSKLTWRRPAMLHAAPFAALFYTWIGAPMYIAVMALSVFALLMLAIFRSELKDPIRVGLLRFFCAVAIWQIIVLILWPELVMELEANMRWWNLSGVLFLATVPTGYLFVADKLKIKNISSLTIALGSAITVLLVAYLFFTSFPKGRVFLYWLTAPRGLTVAEQQPLSLIGFWQSFGTAGLLAALCFPLLFAYRNYTNRQAWLIIPVVFGLILTLLWARTNDFDYIAPVFISLMAACTVHVVITLMGSVRGRSPAYWSPRKARLLFAVMVVVLVVPIWPLRSAQRPIVSSSMAGKLTLHKSAWFSAINWLRQNSAEPSITSLSSVGADHSSPYPPNSYGVMSAWDYGNFIASSGRRTPVTSQYPTPQSAQWMMSQSEDESIGLLCPNCRDSERVRYAVLNIELVSTLFLAKSQLAGTPASLQQEGYWNVQGSQIPHITYGKVYSDALLTRLFRFDGIGLSRYRLVYESKEQQFVHYQYHAREGRVSLTSSPIYSDQDRLSYEQLESQTVTTVGGAHIYGGQILSDIKIFEIVNGAIIEDEASPEAEIEITLALESSVTGRRFTYRQNTTADSTGRYGFRVPYASKMIGREDRSSTLRSLSKYQITIRDEDVVIRKALDVTEEDVQAGRRVLVFETESASDFP